AAVGAVGHADAGVEQSQVVVDLGDGADRRARVPRRRLLVDGDRRRQPFDEVDIGLIHLAQELAGIGGQRLHVPALAFGIDRVEGEGGLPRPRQACEHDQPLAGQFEAEVLQVVLPGPANHKLVSHGSRLPPEQVFDAYHPRVSPRRWAALSGLAAAVPSLVWAADSPGLIADDWRFAARAHFDGFWHLLSSGATSSPGRPLAALYYAVTYTLFGTHPVPHALAPAVLNGLAG